MSTTTTQLAQSTALSGKVLTFYEQYTPESTPEPETLKLPDETDTPIVKSERLTSLIQRIQSAGEDPWLVLGVRNSRDFEERASRILKTLEKAGEENIDGANDALTKSKTAYTQLDDHFKASKRWLKHVQDQKDTSFGAVLGLDKEDDDPTANYNNLKCFLNPEILKEDGVAEALNVLETAMNQAKEVDKTMDDVSEEDSSDIDTETLALYQSASPLVLQLFKGQSLTKEIKDGFSEINEKIKDHNKERFSENEVDGLQISVRRLENFLDNASPFLAKLKTDRSDEEAKKGLAKVNQELLEHNKQNHYPTSWQIRFHGPMDDLLASIPVPTEIDVPYSEGLTQDGGKIIRYTNHGKGNHSFLVLVDGRFYFKGTKDIGETAANSYVQNEGSAFKMGTFYGEEKYQVKYSKTYFKELEQNQDPGRPAITFLGAARRSYRTKTGKTLPSECCVILIRDGKNEWYDVFARSVWVKLYKNDAGRRFDKYWRDLGLKPSEKDVDDGKLDDGKSDDGKQGRQGRTTDNPLQDDVKQLKKDVEALQSLGEVVRSLQTNMKMMTETMDRFTKTMESLNTAATTS